MPSVPTPAVGTLAWMPLGYREFAPPRELTRLVACLWEYEPTEALAHRVVPDACVDLIWLAGGGLVIAGADSGPRFVDLPAGVASRGLRLRPGAAGAVLGLPASELLDRQVEPTLVWGNDGVKLQEAVACAGSARRLHILTEAVAQRRAEPDGLVVAAAPLLAAPGSRVARAAAGLGVSERQLRRRVADAVGYGPKTLARVARLRRLIALPHTSLATRALDAGYASQAHMNDEVKRLTGDTPVRFLEDARLTTA